MVFERVFFKYYFFISCVAYCFADLTSITFNVDHKNYSLFAFFSTLALYNIVHEFKENKYNLPRIILIVVGTLLSLHFLAFFSLNQLFVLAIASVVSLLYELPQAFKFKGLRYIGYLKILSISFSWFIIVVYIPYQDNASQGVNYDLLYFGIWIFLWCYAFDIRDRITDLGKIKTLASLLSPLQSILIISMLCIGGFLLSPSPLFSIMMIVVSLANILSFRIDNKYFSLVVVDGFPILWLLLI
ncbi:MAG: hypothetical protein ACPGR7_04810 [Flavobacteriaceae bacterium]